MTVEPGDFPSGDTAGFMNVIVLADSAETAQAKVEAYFATFAWHVIQTESSRALDPDFIADNDEFADMIERARTHPNPIICGTFHSYKTN